jgi:hypothetical protein
VAGWLGGGRERVRISCSSICMWSRAGLSASLGSEVGLFGPVMGMVMLSVQLSWFQGTMARSELNVTCSAQVLSYSTSGR